MKPYIILILLVIIAFAYSINNSFVWDDFAIIANNPRIDLSPKEVLSVFTMPLSKFIGLSENEHVYYRPVLFIFFILNYKIWGMNPIGFHLVNLLLYLITAIVIYKAGLPLFESDKDKNLISLMAASLFAVHPLNSEMAGRAASGEVIFGLFVILALYFYLRERKYLSLITFFLALLSKEPAVMFPFALLILTTHKKGLKKGLIEIIPYFALIGIYLILRMMTLDTVLGMKAAEPILTRILTMAVAALDYIRLLLIPFPLSLFYPARWYTSILEPKVLVAMAVLLSIVFLAFKLRKDRVMLFLLLFPFVMLAPVIWRVNTFPHGTYYSAYIAERFIYVSIMPFSIFISASAVRLFKETGRRYLVAGWALVLIIFTVITISSSRAWKNDLTLFTKMIEQEPNAGFAHNNIGIAYHKQKNINEAIKEFQAAVRLTPEHVEAHYNLGAVYYIQGRTSEAIQEFKTVLTLNPDYPKVHYSLGSVYYDKGQMSEAVEEYKKALLSKPDYPEAHFRLGLIYYSQGQLDASVQEYKTAIKFKPLYVTAYNSLGIAYYKQKRFDEAIGEYLTALKIKPDYAEAHYNLGLVYIQKGLKSEAVQEFRTALKIQPGLIQAQHHLESLTRQKISSGN